MQESFFEKTIIDQQHLIAYASDPDTYEILYMTQAAASLCGLNAREAYGKKCYELIQGRNAPCPFCTNDKLKLDVPYRWEHYNEKLQRWMDITDILVPFQGKNRRLEFARDITEQKETFDRVSNRLSVEEALVDCIQTLSGETDVTVAVNRFLALIGRFYAADRAYIFEYGENVIYNTFEWCAPGVSREIENLQEIPLEYIANWNDKFEHDGEFYITSLGRELVVDSNEYRILHDQGIESLSAAPLMKQGKIIGFLGVDNPTENVEDLSLLRNVCGFVLDEMERRRLIEELERASYTDLLTGVSNRNCYIKKLGQLYHGTLHTLGVIYIDINGMKKLNDNFGHEYGDRVIQNVADILRVRAESNAFRVGGDEFVVLCENTKQEDFQALADSLRRDFEKSRDFEVSIGCTWKDRDISVDNLMYAQKQGYYHTILHGGGHTRTGIATEILREIADRRFVIYYQPQISLKTGRIMGAEALIRKRDDSGRLIPPDQFIPYYERERVISHLDLHVFQTVCSDLREWAKQGVKTRISSNFSRMTLMASDIVQQLAQICRDYDVPTQQLTIEVTESISKLEAGQLLTLMRLLLGEGFSISLDDFGSQYSNLSILTMLEFNEIKFDKSLVEELGSNIKSRVVMKNAMQICRELPKTCSLAEGIETIEQLELLRQYQCEYGQGYYFAKPMKVEAFLDLLKKEQALDAPVLTGNNPPDEE
ncbi:EAL domain-containing protein [Enterocloster bolteae]|uniref:EAL domain-containing protein n=1 Tax=Enterocloster bolteae TaxID=208479 RepID=UPI0028DC2889|nr:EAL domain-containing protein [Enterocloster bolteae]